MGFIYGVYFFCARSSATHQFLQLKSWKIEKTSEIIKRKKEEKDI